MNDDATNNRRAIVEVETLLNDVFVGSVLEAEASIKFGSPRTGAPGQPVDTGNLRNSWLHEFNDPRNPTSAEIGTPVEYAEAVEDAVGPRGAVVYGKSGVGGSHSLKLTVAGFGHIVDDVTRRADERRRQGQR